MYTGLSRELADTKTEHSDRWWIKGASAMESMRKIMCFRRLTHFLLVYYSLQEEHYLESWCPFHESYLWIAYAVFVLCKWTPTAVKRQNCENQIMIEKMERQYRWWQTKMLIHFDIFQDKHLQLRNEKVEGILFLRHHQQQCEWWHLNYSRWKFAPSLPTSAVKY